MPIVDRAYDTPSRQALDFATRAIYEFGQDEGDGHVRVDRTWRQLADELGASVSTIGSWVAALGPLVEQPRRGRLVFDAAALSRLTARPVANQGTVLPGDLGELAASVAQFYADGLEPPRAMRQELQAALSLDLLRDDHDPRDPDGAVARPTREADPRDSRASTARPPRVHRASQAPNSRNYQVLGSKEGSEIDTFLTSSLPVHRASTARDAADRASAARTEESHGERDWTTEDLARLLQPADAVCQRAGLRGIDNFDQLVVELSRYRALDRIAHGVNHLVAAVNSGVRWDSPFGVLVARARAGDPVWFPADPAGARAAGTPVSHLRPVAEVLADANADDDAEGEASADLSIEHARAALRREDTA